MSKKIILTLSILLTALFMGFKPSTAHAGGFGFNPIVSIIPDDSETVETTFGLYNDVNEMADRIVETEDEILIMSDRIVETEEIVATVSPNDDFDNAALDASAETRETMDLALVENTLPENELDTTENNDDSDNTILALSDDIGEIADRILYTEEEIGIMADRIVETEYLLAETAQDLDSTPTFTLSDAEVAPELVEHTLEQIIETTPSTDTVTQAIPYESMEVIENKDGASQEDTLILADDIGEMADNIIATEGDIGETADEIVETENIISSSLLKIWN